MTYICDLENKLIREKAGISKPVESEYYGRKKGSFNYNTYAEDARIYERKIASLKTYPIIGNNWVDKKEYQEEAIEIEYCSCRRPTGSVATTCFQSCGKEEVARLKQPIDQQKTIRQECEQMYSQISKAEERLKTLRAVCKHPNTFEGNYSYRVGCINKAIICSDCGEVLKPKFR